MEEGASEGAHKGECRERARWVQGGREQGIEGMREGQGGSQGGGSESMREGARVRERE